MLLQHGCSWSSDHHTSVNKQLSKKKNKIDDIIHVQERYRNFFTCVVTAFLRAKILVENRSLYDKCF